VSLSETTFPDFLSINDKLSGACLISMFAWHFTLPLLMTSSNMAVVVTNEVFRCGGGVIAAADDDDDDDDNNDERLFSTHRTLVDTLAASNSLSKLPK
jgi:hypothetical protein